MKILGLSPLQILGAVIIGIVFSFAFIAGSAPQPVKTPTVVITPVPTPAPILITPEATPIPQATYEFEEAILELSDIFDMFPGGFGLFVVFMLALPFVWLVTRVFWTRDYGRWQ